MKSAYRNLVQFSLDQGHTVSVWDGEEWQVKRCSEFGKIIDAIKSVEVSQLNIRSYDGTQVGWAQIIPDLEPDETVADNSCSTFMEEWDKYYEKVNHEKTQTL